MNIGLLPISKTFSVFDVCLPVGAETERDKEFIPFESDIDKSLSEPAEPKLKKYRQE